MHVGGGGGGVRMGKKGRERGAKEKKETRQEMLIVYESKYQQNFPKVTLSY